MESKITIHTGDDFKPVIKVIEKDSDDVRDNLIVQLRSLLRHTSRSFTIEFIQVPENQGIRAGYYISPVTDEMTYFKRVIVERATGGLPVENSPVVHKIDEFFHWLKDECGVFG